MALTLISDPNNYDSAYRPVKLVVETSVSNLDLVQFELRNNVTNSLISTINKRNDFADTDSFSVDFSNQIQDQLGVDIDNLTVGNGVVQGANVLKEFRVDATEKILVSGSLTDGDSLTGSGFFIMNSTLDIGESSLITQDYFTTISGTKLLTNKPRFITRQGESEYVALYNNGENVKATITVTYSDNTTATGVVNSLSTGTEVSYFGVGYQNINNYTLDTGSQPLLDEDAVSYTVQFETVASATVFELLSVTIDSLPCRTNKRFHFENKFGTIDSFTFTAFEEKSINVISTQAQRVISDFTNTESFGKFKSNTEKETIFRTGTNNIKENEREWLEEMLSSANVYLQSGNDYLPVIINDDSNFAITSNKFNSDIFALEIEYILANNLRRQKN